MKTFIDNNGIFEIKVPSSWKYSLKDGKVHTFQEYDIWQADAFQISIRPISDANHKAQFEARSARLPTTKVGEQTLFSLPDFFHPNVGKGEHTTTNWISVIDNNIVIFTLTHSTNGVEDKPLGKKMQVALDAIATFELIPAVDAQKRLNHYRFTMFLQGVGATALMLSRAVSNKAFIEATCVIGNQIDALLRIGIVLKKQLINNSSDIELEWIYQGLSDKKKSEKTIYDEAEKLGVITASIKIKLYELYEDRNRVVHRFIISEITVAEIEDIAFNYHKLCEQINKVIYDLEEEQIKLKVGMTVKGGSNQDEAEALEFIMGKVGKDNYFDDVSNDVESNTDTQT